MVRNVFRDNAHCGRELRSSMVRSGKRLNNLRVNKIHQRHKLE